MKLRLPLADLMHLPWGWQGPTEVREPGEEPYFEIRIRELPDYFVAGRTREEVLTACAPALRAFLQSYLDADEMPPLPANPEPSWLVSGPLIGTPATLPRVRDPQEAILTGVTSD
jgi:predicted RNase H-like HicB family nuclease